MKKLTKTVVHLPTEEDYIEFTKIAEKEGWTWYGGFNADYLGYGYGYWRMEYISVDSKGELSWSSNKSGFPGYKIITLKQLKDMNKTLENLKVGDTVININRQKIDVLGSIGTMGGILYVMSKHYTKDNEEKRNEYGDIYTIFTLETQGYTHYSSSLGEIEKAMEVLEKAGKIVDGKIIK